MKKYPVTRAIIIYDGKNKTAKTHIGIFSTRGEK